MEKRGQFFLIAAIIISLIIVSLGTVYISTRTPTAEETAVYDLSSEIKAESNQVIDNGVFNARDVSSFLNQLTANYSKSNPDMDMIVVYGGTEGVCILNYTSIEIGGVGIGSGAAQARLPNTVLVRGTACNIQPKNGIVTLPFGNATYTFNLHEGKNFFVILGKKKEHEKIVAVE